MKYRFSYDKPEQHFIQISFEIDNVEQSELELQLPAWRPGRYELGDFAKNVRDWEVTDGDGNPLTSFKKTKDCWVVEAVGAKKVIAHYSYYAAQLDAGACWLDEDQLYVNPVHCCLYVVGREDELCEVFLDVPSDYQVATSLTAQSDRHYTAEDFQELVDSPFIASAGLQHKDFELGGCRFHVWFAGEIKVDWGRLLTHYKAYTEAQIAAFGDFPVKEYHYLIQIPPYRAYHGVEHCKSTVISLGPPYSIFTDLYNDLMGVSCHELYHTWNIKNIRPAEMMPYDLAKENYSNLGYVAEGVTTYMGDQMLHRARVFDDAQYFQEINKQLQRHFDNPGRNYRSVAESSFDTWLDGYVAGIPGRKVSIYTEGCLLAMVADLKILHATNGEKSLDDVMRQLYERFGKKGLGYTEEDYFGLLEEIGGISFENYFFTLINGTEDYYPWLVESLAYVGLDVKHPRSAKVHEGAFGIKMLADEKNTKVLAVHPNSPAEAAGLWADDVVVSVNGFVVGKDLEQWMNYFKEDEIRMIINRRNKLKKITLKADGEAHYLNWQVQHSPNKSAEQKRLFEIWSAPNRRL